MPIFAVVLERAREFIGNKQPRTRESLIIWCPHYRHTFRFWKSEIKDTELFVAGDYFSVALEHAR
jgi:hypothetical protein